MLRGDLDSAALDPLEPELKVSLRVGDRLGHIRAHVEITPDHLAQTHRLEFDLDQSYLPEIIRQCAAILQEYSVRGTPDWKGAEHAVAADDRWVREGPVPVAWRAPLAAERQFVRRITREA